jgi:hypothetical protein
MAGDSAPHRVSGLSRRGFLAGTAGLAGAAALPGAAVLPVRASAASAPSGPALIGDNCAIPQYARGGTQAKAITNWQAATGAVMAEHRVYFTSAPSSVPSWLAQDAAAGRYVAMSFQPPTTIPSSAATAARTAIVNFLAACKAAGVVGAVTFYHEPVREIGSASTYGAVQGFYGPAAAAYYPLCYCGQAAAGGRGIPANYQLYYTAALNAGAVFTTAAIDHYIRDYISGTTGHRTSINIADFPPITDPLPFGIYEFGANEAVFTAAQVSSFYSYLTAFLTARRQTGLPISVISHFTSGTCSELSCPPFTTCRAQQLADYATLCAAVS